MGNIQFDDSKFGRIAEDAFIKAKKETTAKTVAKEVNSDPKEKTQKRATVLLHKERNKHSLTIIDYCVADLIYFFGNGNKSRVMGGWCFASKQHLADNLGIGKATVNRALDTLIADGWIERDNVTHYIRTTDKWYNEIEAYKEKH